MVDSRTLCKKGKAVKKTTRRQALAAVGSAAAFGAGIAVCGATPEPGVHEGTEKVHTPGADARFSREDRRFLFAFNRALLRQRLAGRLDRQKFRDFRLASFNVLNYVRDGKAGSFIQHLRRDINKASNGAFEEVLAAAEMLFEAIVAWLIERWNDIMDDIKANFEALKIAVDTVDL